MLDCSESLSLTPNFTSITWEANFRERFVAGGNFTYSNEQYPSGRRVRVEGERLIINTTQLRSFQVEPDDDSDSGVYRCVVCRDGSGCSAAEVNLYVVGAPPKILNPALPQCKSLYYNK